jgi:UDP-glucose 6-dehydrogenase
MRAPATCCSALRTSRGAVPPRQAEEESMVKYASNAYHALKVAFANEVGSLSQHLGIDGRQVMRIFCEDHDH